MNELQIIHQQLATERQHFAEVAAACMTALDRAAQEKIAVDGDDFYTSVGFVQACGDYFAFALTRFDADSSRDAVVKLDAARTADMSSGDGRWRDFLQAFNGEVTRRFASLDAFAAQNRPIVEWRAISRIDADSIFNERSLYGRVKAALPPGAALGAAPSPTAAAPT